MKNRTTLAAVLAVLLCTACSSNGNENAPANDQGCDASPCEMSTQDGGCEACTECEVCAECESCSACEANRTTSQLTDLDAVMDALEAGHHVRLELDLADCTGPAGAQFTGKVGMLIDVFEYFGPGVVYPNSPGFVSFSETVLNKGNDLFYHYRKARAYPDGTVKYMDARLDGKTFETQTVDEFECTFATANSAGAKFFYETDREAHFAGDDATTYPGVLPTFADLEAALEQGRTVRSIFDYDKCILNGQGAGPHAVGGLEAIVWSHFAAGTHSTHDGEAITYFGSRLANIYGFGVDDFVYNWATVDLKDDDTVHVYVEFINPVSLQTEFSEYFDCDMNDAVGGPNGATYFAY